MAFAVAGYRWQSTSVAPKGWENLQLPHRCGRIIPAITVSYDSGNFAVVARKSKNEREFRALLEAHGLTQEQAAELLKVSHSRVRAWMKPSSPNPTPSWAVNSLRLLLKDKSD